MTQHLSSFGYVVRKNDSQYIIDVLGTRARTQKTPGMWRGLLSTTRLRSLYGKMKQQSILTCMPRKTFGGPFPSTCAEFQLVHGNFVYSERENIFGFVFEQGFHATLFELSG